MSSTSRKLRSRAFAGRFAAAVGFLVILAAAAAAKGQAVPAGGAAGGPAGGNDWNGVLTGGHPNDARAAPPAPVPAPAPAAVVPQPAAPVNPAAASAAAAVVGQAAPAGTPAPATPLAAVTNAAAPPPAPVSDYAKTSLRRGAAGEDKAAADGKPAVTTGAGDVLRVVVALAIVLAVIFFLKWGSRRIFAMPSADRSSRAVHVLSRTALSPKQQLVLLQVGQRVLVVADSGGTMNSLCEITDPDEIAVLVGQLRAEKVSVATHAFGGLFDRVRKRFAGGSVDEDVDDADRHADATRSERAELLESPDGDAGYDEAQAEEAVAAARHELDGLRDRMRRVSEQYGEPGATERA